MSRFQKRSIESSCSELIKLALSDKDFAGMIDSNVFIRASTGDRFSIDVSWKRLMCKRENGSETQFELYIRQGKLTKDAAYAHFEPFGAIKRVEENREYVKKIVFFSSSAAFAAFHSMNNKVIDREELCLEVVPEMSSSEPAGVKISGFDASLSLSDLKELLGSFGHPLRIARLENNDVYVLYSSGSSAKNALIVNELQIADAQLQVQLV